MTLEQKVEQLLKELSNFSDAKVGDKAFSLRDGESVITDINIHARCPIVCGENLSYTKDGKIFESYKFPTLFKSNPFIAIAKLFNENKNNEERWIEVLHDDGWHRRKLITIKKGKAIYWKGASTEEEVLNATQTFAWDKWREIQPEVELTLEQIAEKFGIHVDKLKIKK